MNRYKLLIIAILACRLLGSCAKKDEGVGLPNNAAALTLVNLIGGSNGVYTNFTPISTGKGPIDTLKWYSTAAEIGYGGFGEFSLGSGAQELAIVSVTDTAAQEWSGGLVLAVGSIYSLFFVGPDTLHIDTLLTTDIIPNYPMGDSVIGVRIVNLAQGTDPIMVDIQGGNDTLARSLGYKSVTGFFTLPATSTIPVGLSYTFEFRDMATGSVLATYNYTSLYEFKSISIVFFGEGALGNWSTIEVNDF